MFRIDRYDFDKDAVAKVSELTHDKISVGVNWPIVYVINNDKEAYVGETVNASRRIDQHLQNEERKKLTEIRIISDGNFNKSVILDLESFLIKYMGSDGRFQLQNGNNGIRDHDYYERSIYKEEFTAIWEKLRELGVVKNSIRTIENSELFKYSPYKSLGAEQIKAESEIIKAFAANRDHENGTTVLVKGGAGTGKTILAIYLLKLFADVNLGSACNKEIIDDFPDEDAETISALDGIGGISKIGIVLPQKSLQTSLKDVFSKVKGLNKKMIFSPADVVKDYIKTGKKFDLLLVDEAHRLKYRSRGHLSNYAIFDKCNRDLGLDKNEGTELDWLMICSRNQILFRDELQTVRPCDIDGETFYRLLMKKYDTAVVTSELNTQWRCEGGNDYIAYIRNILSCKQTEPRTIENYDLRLYDDCAQMISDIKKKNEEMGLCRVVAGYAWPWKRSEPEHYTIEIQGRRYRWNMTYNNWITTPTAIDEIGCIHTVQGYDLNYVGVIIGEDIKYDPEKKTIIADKDNYYDQQGKSGVANDPEALKEYLCNIYLTLMTRGIKGCYVYVCDEELREYMREYIIQK